MAGKSDRLPDMGDIVRKIPGYRIERELGRGSMGVVYLAEDIQLRRKVALKILTPTLADDELFRKRFDRESQSAANLDHPNIVPVYAAGEAGGSLYIAMRYVRGGDLRALLETDGPLSLEQTTSIIAPVADALDAAHAQGLVHRDVKPANILIDSGNGQQHYYLSDFGITKILSSGRSLTSTGQIVGTIDYIAPEQIQGKPVDGRADLYALGCVLYQCLTGMVPFPREETAALMWAHVHDGPSPVSDRRPDLSPQIDLIVAKAMAKQPEDRFATCRELALALRAVAADPAASDESWKVIPARPVDSPPPPLVSSGMTSTYTAPTPAPVRVPRTASRSQWRWWRLVLGGVLALALIGGSTPIVVNYLSSRFPNEAEQALLDQVPLALTLKNSCDRNDKIQPDTANVQASVTCTPDGDAANTIVFTKFTSSQALDNHYQTAVAAAGSVQGSGDCLSAERAEAIYASESGRMSGRAVCYQQRGSSFIAWTDEKSQMLGLATRVDPDYVKLRDWWAGVVGLPTMAESEAKAEARRQVEEAQKQAEETKQQAENARMQQEDEAKRQAEEARKQVAEAKQQAEDARKQQQEDDRKQQQEDTRKQQQEDDRKQQKEDDSKRQAQVEDDRGQRQDDTKTNVDEQDIQQLIDDAISRAIQQQQGNAGGQGVKQQIEEEIRRSIQQRRTNSESQSIQQQIDDAIKRALEQNATTPRR